MDLQSDVDDAVTAINRISSSGRLATAHDVARFVVGRFFGGELEAFRRRRNRSVSLRRLAMHPFLHIGRTRLWEALAIHASCAILPPEVLARLSYSHHRALVGVKSDAARIQVAREAAADAWTVRELTRRVKALRAAEAHGRTGRPPSPPMARNLQRMLHALRLAYRCQPTDAPQVRALAYDIAILWDPLHARIISLGGGGS